MQITVKITNVYVEHGTFVATETADVPPPPGGAVFDAEWADLALFPLTGTGRDGDAGYWVEVLDCPDHPELVGTEYGWEG